MTDDYPTPGTDAPRGPRFSLSDGLSILVVVVIVLGASAVAAALLFAFLRKRRPRPPTPLGLLPPVARDAYDFDILDETLPAVDRRRPVLTAQSTAWQAALATTGRRLAENGGVRTIIYAHGTFVGSDPLGVAGLLRDLHPSLGQRLAAKSGELIRKGSNWVARDLGNFSPEYVALCQAGLHPAIACRDFQWSSANNHLARLEGAVALLRVAVAAVEDSFDLRRHRLLLLGHSHAGQVFALFTQLVGDGELHRSLGDLLAQEGLLAAPELKHARATLGNAAIDFVTLGTAPNYPWSLGPRQRLLHVINHRGDEPEGGDLSGVLLTKTGDYVQQFGLTGSDTLALTRRERQVNTRLNALLGRGVSVTALIGNLRNRRRLSAQGFTVLVDFRDAGVRKPNFLRTFFGHGGYTRYDALLFLHRLIAQHFY